ncbi:hypothetical protein GOC53_27860 [Sinorhizobium medicae]|nr:hypothetical protein [Sinorhizobium medicae]
MSLQPRAFSCLNGNILPEQVFVRASAIGEGRTRRYGRDDLAADPSGKMPGPSGWRKRAPVCSTGLAVCLATTRASRSNIPLRLSQQNRFHLNRKGSNHRVPCGGFG